MAKKKKNAKKDAEWAEGKKLCRLSAEDVLKAKALGMGPRALIKNRPNPSERWKAPVNEWIRQMYFKRFGTDKIAPAPSSPKAMPQDLTDSGQDKPAVQPVEPLIADNDDPPF
jgi:hypothetical protein